MPGKGIRYDVYTAGEFRNDFEFHGQLVRQLRQIPSTEWVQVNGFGTSYEYHGWVGGNGQTFVPDWYPLNKKFHKGRPISGVPQTISTVKFPASTDPLDPRTFRSSDQRQMRAK